MLEKTSFDVAIKMNTYKFARKYTSLFALQKLLICTYKHQLDKAIMIYLYVQNNW